MFRLLRFVLALSLLLAAALPARAETPSAADAASFQKVIAAQVAAFQADQWEVAFSYAAPRIQAMFGNPERFQRMVLGGYEAVARPRVFKFDDATLIDKRPAHFVLVVGPDGIPRRGVYFMERQSDGSWRIAGVLLKRAPDLAS